MESDAGLIAPSRDVDGFAARLMKLHDAPVLRAQLGARALAKVQNHYSVTSQAAKLWKIIERQIFEQFAASNV